MIVLTIRTDKPEAEVGLFVEGNQTDYEVWTAHRELSLTILQKIEELLRRNDKTFQDLSGIVAYKGPGSFTGLRIGISVANTLAYGLSIPIVGSDEASWIQDGLSRLNDGQNEKIALPVYNREPNITQPKK